MNGPAGVVLAAGRSARMGSPKQLLHVHGRPMLVGAARTLLDAGADPVIVVVPPGAAFPAALAGLHVQINVNDDPSAGQGLSLRIALSALGDRRDVVVHLGDMPFVTARMLRRLHRRHAAAGVDATVATTGTADGPPLVLGTAAIRAIMGTTRPPRALLRGGGFAIQRVRLPSAALVDIDTPADHARAVL